MGLGGVSPAGLALEPSIGSDANPGGATARKTLTLSAVSVVRGVLLDVGGVLVGPAGGRWNPRFDFEDVLLRHLPTVDLRRFDKAVATGDAWLASTPPPHPKHGYHRVVLTELGVETPPAQLLDELAGPPPGPVFEAFADVTSVLDRLAKAGLRLAVVTDSEGTSDTKRRQLAEVGLDHYFGTIVVSDELGCTKPHPRMFDTARQALGLERSECLVVDDVPDLVRAAIALGYQGAAVVRNDMRPPDLTGFPTLDGILTLLGLA